MFFHSGHFAVLAGATSLLIAIGAEKALAGDFQTRTLPLAPFEDWQALDHCAAYGPDFTSVAGSDTCVRIGGRVRVQYGFHKSPYDGGDNWANSRPAAMRSESANPDVLDGIEQGHLHVHNLDGQNDPFH